MLPKWLQWAQALQAIAQNGLGYATTTYDLERYQRVQDIAAEMMAASFDLEVEVVRNLLAQERGYATPKVDVRAVVFREDALLLIRELEDDRWSLPGGWADIGESPSEVAVREVQEEAGYAVRAVRLLAVLDRNKHSHPPIPFHAYKIFLRCELLNAPRAERVEAQGVAFFREDALPELSETRVTREQITRLFRHLRHPEGPADFD